MRFNDLNFRKKECHWVRITPNIASKILRDRNYADNRKISDTWVIHLANQMEKGLWQDNGESVIFDNVGYLINGQHRLTAIILAEMPQNLLIATGVEQSSFTTMDQTRVRTAGMVFWMKGIERPIPTAAICRKILLWETRGRLSKRGKVSPDELLLIQEKYPQVRESVIVAEGVRRRVPVDSSIVGIGHFLFSQARITRAPAFFSILETGHAEKKKCPVMALREKLIKEKLTNRRWDPDEVFYLFIKNR